MSENLIYNGDFSNGADSWNGTVENGTLTLTGDLSQSTKYLIPIASGNKYQLSFDIKFNDLVSSQRFYWSFIPCDENLNSIPPRYVEKTSRTGTDTTLATDLNDGDTTATLTSATNWVADTTYRSMGICDNPKWGYGRATKIGVIEQNGISGNVITFETPWSGGFYPAGTKVANFTDGASYIYPMYWNLSDQILDTWQTKTVYWTQQDLPGNRMWGCRYIRMGTLGYYSNYSLRNIKLISVNKAQINPFERDITVSIDKNGVTKGSFIEYPDVDQAKIFKCGNLTASDFIEL